MPPTAPAIIGRVTPAALAAVVALAGAQPALAQTDEPEPVHAVIRNGGKATLLGSVATYGGHDLTSFDTTAESLDSRRTSDSNYAGLTGGLNWARPIGHNALSFSGSTDLRYYSTAGALAGLTSNTSAGTVGLSVRTGRRTTLQLTQSGSLSTFYQFDPFSGFILRSPDELLLPTSDYRVDRSRTLATSTTASLNSQVGRYSTLTLDYGMRYVRFPGELLSYQSHSQGVRFQRRLRPSLQFNAGYGFDFSTVKGAVGGRYHRIDLGLSYDTPLPFSRNTLFVFSTGGALVAAQDDATGAVKQVPLVTVSTSLRHQFNRYWATVAEYRRAPHVVELYRDTTYGDTAYLSLQGSPARRIQISISGAFSYDRLNAGRGGLASQTVYGATNFTVRATRLLYAYTEYVYYGFQTGSGQSILDPHLNIRRNALRAGLNWRVPLFKPIPEP